MNNSMHYNFHTHTFRCHHATGTDREYVECAIKAGIKTLGFSDHVPYPYLHGYPSTVRMDMDNTSDYVTAIRSLAAEYKDDIQIFVGFEAEYLRDYWADLRDLLLPYDIDYLILGQHFLHSELDGSYSGAPDADEAKLKEYVDLVIEALNTGNFTYLAHPDLINFTGSDEIYNKHMTRLCLEAKRLSIPLEINFCGYLNQRHYPSKRFFSLAASLGNDFVFGRDAHTPDAFLDEATYNGCSALAEECGISLLPEVTLRKPFLNDR